MIHLSGTATNFARMIALALALTFAPAREPASARQEIQSLVQRVRPSVVTVIAYDVNGGVAQSALGVFVRDEGFLLTRACLFRKATRAEIKTADGTPYALTKLAAIDSAQSLALLAADVGSAPVNAATINTSAPQVGEKVMFFGDATLSEGSLTEGRITDIWLTGAGKVIEISGPPRPIPDGSPVFNMKGEVVGVARELNSNAGKFLANSCETLGKLADLVRSDAGGLAKMTKPLSKELPYTAGRAKLGAATKRVEPAYPQAAKRDSVSGAVVVEVMVNLKGKVISAEMIKGKPVFKEQAEAAALRWEFAPTLICGLPVEVVGSIDFNFNQ